MSTRQIVRWIAHEIVFSFCLASATLMLGVATWVSLSSDSYSWVTPISPIGLFGIVWCFIRLQESERKRRQERTP